jgi:F-type H+-transporting ATPase subunit b
VAELGFHLPSLIVYLVNFLILLALLYFLAYKRILALLDQRSERIRESLAEAERVKQDSAQAQEEMQGQLTAARQEGQQLLEQARQAAERYRVEEQERAQQQAAEFLEKARVDIQQERDAAVEEVRQHFADLALTAAEQVIERSLDRDAHRELIDRVLEESTRGGRS